MPVGLKPIISRKIHAAVKQYIIIRAAVRNLNAYITLDQTIMQKLLLQITLILSAAALLTVCSTAFYWLSVHDTLAISSSFKSSVSIHSLKQFLWFQNETSNRSQVFIEMLTNTTSFTAIRYLNYSFIKQPPT